jgi:hypothetical protein
LVRTGKWCVGLSISKDFLLDFVADLLEHILHGFDILYHLSFFPLNLIHQLVLNTVDHFEQLIILPDPALPFGIEHFLQLDDLVAKGVDQKFGSLISEVLLLLQQSLRGLKLGLDFSRSKLG